MKKGVYQGLTALMVMASAVAYGQNYENNRQNDDRNYNSRSSDSRSNDSRSSRYEDERYDRNSDSRNNDSRNNDSRNGDSRDRDSRRDSDMRRRDDDRDRSTDSDRYRSDNRTFRRYEDQDLQQAYDKGYDDGMNDVEKNGRKERRENYKNFTFGLYGGLNSTRFDGEDVDGDNLSGRLGYQLGGYVRGGGRIYGQIGVEYLTSSSDFYGTSSDTTVNLNEVIKNVDQKYLHIPAYIGIKLAQSPRGLSAIRLQVGAELATITGSGNNSDFSFNNSTINGLANLGFDAGPLTVDFVYHHGFNNTIRDQAASSKPRILGVNVGLKF